ncbi:hypothetical protein MHYP_G00097990 [Metynnis hypsauchen]
MLLHIERGIRWLEGDNYPSQEVCILGLDFLAAAGALLDLGKEKLGLVMGQVKLLAVAGGMVGREESHHTQEEGRDFFSPFHSGMPVDRTLSSAVRQPAKVRANRTPRAECIEGREHGPEK